MSCLVIEATVMPCLHSHKDSTSQDENESAKNTFVSSHTLLTCFRRVALGKMLVNRTRVEGQEYLGLLLRLR